MSGGSSTPDKTTTTTELPTWAQPYSQQLLQRGAALSSQNMPVYTGQRTAGLNGMQTQGMQMATQRATNGDPTLNAGAQNVQDTLNGTYLSSGNPYLSGAIDAASQDVTRNYNSAVNGTDATFARSGAFGGSAWQQAQGDNSRNLANSLGNLSTNMHMQDYTNERNNQMQAQNTALTYGNQAYTDANALMGAGATQFGYDQQQLTDQQNLFNEQAQAPYASLDVLANTIRGAVGGGGSITQTAPGSNGLAQGVGAAASLYSLFGK